VKPSRTVVALVLTLLALVAPPAATDDLEAARAAQAEAARRYRGSLETLLPLQESALERAGAEAERRRTLLGLGLIARTELEAAEQVEAGAREAVSRTRASLREADGLVAEAEAAGEVAALPPPAVGELRESPSVIHYAGAGGGRWSLAAVPALERFFAHRFGQPLPISALGQTPAHDRLGFDHRNALDVAVHPDSREGRALMEHLRAHGIPFLAFRAARPGMATGAHVHVGEPSVRLSRKGRIIGRVARLAEGPGEAR
jgi:hypothetical protein